MDMPTMNADTEAALNADPVLTTVAKIALNDDDNVRGYDLTVTGSGFNNGVTADVYVLSGNDAVWDTLDCASDDYLAVGMTPRWASRWTTDKASPLLQVCTRTVDRRLTNYGPRWTGWTSATIQPKLRFAQGIIAEGANPGSGTVGSDDKIAITFGVTVPTFTRGDQNYICMVDGEGRASTSDVEKFKLESSIRVVPSTVSAGDTVNVFAQDFPTTDAHIQIREAGEQERRSTMNSGQNAGRRQHRQRRFGHGDVRRSGRSERHHPGGRRSGAKVTPPIKTSRKTRRLSSARPRCF